MTLHAGKARMFARQPEGKIAVIEILPKLIYAVMTVETGRTERQGMRGHEGGIHLTVTGIAGLRREGCDIPLVAVVALERCSRCSLLMGV